jgi:hypothetical protein
MQFNGNLRLVHGSNLDQGTGHQQRFQGNATPADNCHGTTLKQATAVALIR